MLNIVYLLDGNVKNVAEYKSTDQFVANQQLEVPDFEDSLKILKVSIDGKTVDLVDSTISGLYNYLIETK
ncbi:hypothetical protein [Lactobacillus terrae]|uniref:hypothetical protein n=1 Tax=Lactobacillus terrae TaxID=2269374 RepID=UPI000C1B729C|nr:hypothetical protein [Lactobacillus terrae]